MAPYFSIIIPTYNRANSLIKLLHTFFNQTYTNFEIIIVDDGSTDNTEELVKQISDKRIYYYKKNNGGVSSARNFGLKKATAKIINFFDSDDLAYSNHLQLAFNFFETNPNAQTVIFDHDWGNEEQINFKKISNRYKNPNKEILKRNFISTDALFIEKTIADSLSFNEKLTISEDWEYWIRLSLKSKFYTVNIPTSYVVEHKQRGINNININYLINQKDILINTLRSNVEVFKQININIIDSHFSSFIALQATLSKNKRIALTYFIKSVNLYNSSIFSRRTLAIFKHLLINKN